MAETGKDVYIVPKAQCNNCGATSTSLVIPRGKRVNEAICPECGCKDVLYRISEDGPGMVG
jgi:predicted  nucleic acid-binding Zn-ribbon protein